jgi:hypothetical protein
LNRKYIGTHFFSRTIYVVNIREAFFVCLFQTWLWKRYNTVLPKKEGPFSKWTLQVTEGMRFMLDCFEVSRWDKTGFIHMKYLVHLFLFDVHIMEYIIIDVIKPWYFFVYCTMHYYIITCTVQFKIHSATCQKSLFQDPCSSEHWYCNETLLWTWVAPLCCQCVCVRTCVFIVILIIFLLLLIFNFSSPFIWYYK